MAPFAEKFRRAYDGYRLADGYQTVSGDADEAVAGNIKSYREALVVAVHAVTDELKKNQTSTRSSIVEDVDLIVRSPVGIDPETIASWARAINKRLRRYELVAFNRLVLLDLLSHRKGQVPELERFEPTPFSEQARVEIVAPLRDNLRENLDALETQRSSALVEHLCGHLASHVFNALKGQTASDESILYTVEESFDSGRFVGSSRGLFNNGELVIALQKELMLQLTRGAETE